MTHDAELQRHDTASGTTTTGHDHGMSTAATTTGTAEASCVRAAIKDIFAPHSHDAADCIDAALESSAAGIRAVKISLVVLWASPAIAQLVVVLISGSVALLADTIHNFSDALTAVPLWIAFALAAGPPPGATPTATAAPKTSPGCSSIAMITLSAVVAGYESIAGCITPQPIDHLGWVAAAGLIGFVGNELVALYRIRVGRQIGSAALVADGLHARTDGFTSLAVLLGAGGVALGFPLADPIVGLLITVAILAVLRTAARDVFRRLHGRRRPRPRRRRRSRAGRRTRRHRRAQRQDALDRAPHPRRRRTRHRPRHQPHRRPPHRARRRTHPHPRRPQTVHRPRPRLSRGHADPAISRGAAGYRGS